MTSPQLLRSMGLFSLRSSQTQPAIRQPKTKKPPGAEFMTVMRSTLSGMMVMPIQVPLPMISRMEDIKRTFMYHGSEHKCINCLEHGLVLNVENVRKSSKEHKRCGTSFLLIVMVISILFFMVVRVDTIWLRIVSRIVLIPVIAGVSYEVLRLAGTSNSKIMDIVSRPGMWMQGLTTKEPDDSMIEVAIVAVEAVFDWKKISRSSIRQDILREKIRQGRTRRR